MNAAANLHAIWLDDLAPGEGSTPIWDALYAEQDAETQRVVFNACADEHTEPVSVAAAYWASAVSPEDRASTDNARALSLAKAEVMAANVKAFEDEMATPLFTAKPTPKKKPTPRKPATKKATPRKKPGVLADAEAKLAGVAARVKAQTDEMGGNDAGEVNTLGIAFVCLLGLLLAPAIVAVFG